MVLTLRGGMKKRKALDEPTKIPDVLGKVEIKATDPDVVSGLLDIEAIDIEAMVNTLSMAQLEKLDSVVDKYEKIMGSDTSIKAIAEFHPDMENLQECIIKGYAYPQNECLCFQKCFLLRE